MDKNKTKQIAQSVGIKTPKSYRTVEEIERFPVIIKPVDEGSSKGLFLCNNKEEAQEAVKISKTNNRRLHCWRRINSWCFKW